MYAFSLFRLPPAAKILPGAGSAHRADVEHRLCAPQRPTHAALLHAIFDDMPTGSLDHAAGDRIACLQVLLVTHTMGVLLEVVARRRDLLQRRSLELSLTGHPSHSRHHPRHLSP